MTGSGTSVKKKGRKKKKKKKEEKEEKRRKGKKNKRKKKKKDVKGGIMWIVLLESSVVRHDGRTAGCLRETWVRGCFAACGTTLGGCACVRHADDLRPASTFAIVMCGSSEASSAMVPNFWISDSMYFRLCKSARYQNPP